MKNVLRNSSARCSRSNALKSMEISEEKPRKTFSSFFFISKRKEISAARWFRLEGAEDHYDCCESLNIGLDVEI